MESFSFIHAADLHLDTPFTGVGKVDPKLQKMLHDASLNAFDNLIHAAIRQSVDFVLLAGDIYDGIEHGVRAQARFLKGIRELDRHNIKSFFIHGNHDPVEEGWSALRPEDLPASAIRFDQSDEVRAKPVVRNGRTIAVVYGISFRLKAEPRNLSKLFPDRSGGNRPFHIGLLHCNVGRQDGHGDYAPCSLDDLCSRSIDYWALGHIHERTVLSSRNPVVVYPGNLQARRFDESGPKGATLVRVDSSGAVKLELLELDIIRFAHLQVNVSGNDSLEQILITCEERCAKAVREADGRLLIARITLGGTTSAHSDLLKTKARDELLLTFSDRLQLDGFHLDSVLVATNPPVDREKAAQSGGFEAALLGLNDNLFGSADDLESLLQHVRSPLLKRGQFDEFLPESESLRARTFVHKAESQLLGMLEPDGD